MRKNFAVVFMLTASLLLASCSVQDDAPVSANTPSPTESASAAEPAGNTAGNILNWGLVAQSGDWIYYVDGVQNSGIYRMRTDGKGQEKLNDEKSFYINVINDKVYYSSADDGWKLCSMRADGTDRSVLYAQRSQDILVVGDWIYFINGNIYDNVPGSICKIRTDGTGMVQLTKEICQDINVVGDDIYYANWSEKGRLYRMRTDGTGRRKLNDDICVDVNVVRGWVYYRNDSGTRGLYKMKTDGTGRTLLYGGSVYCLNVSGGSVYFCNWENGSGLPGPMYRISVNGGEAALLDPHNGCSDVNLVEGWIYHENLADQGKIYRLRTDGSVREAVG